MALILWVVSMNVDGGYPVKNASLEVINDYPSSPLSIGHILK